MPRDADTLARVRRALLALLALGCAGTIGELLLAKHTEGAWQVLPISLSAVALVVVVVLALKRRPMDVWAMRVLMIMSIASGVIGVYLHYRGKTEFALERRPGLTGAALFREALKGANPPLLAPGTMIALGLLGLIATYRHSQPGETT